MDRIILEKMVVPTEYFFKMVYRRRKLIEKYLHYNYRNNRNQNINLLKYREEFNDYSDDNFYFSSYHTDSWNSVVSSYVKYMWAKTNVDEPIDGKTQKQTKDEIMSEIEKLWRISAYLNIKNNQEYQIDDFDHTRTINVVIITVPGRDKSTLRTRNDKPNIKLEYGKEPTRTSDAITDNDPFGIEPKTVEPITTENSVTKILKGLAPYVASVALGAWVTWYIIRQQNRMDGMDGMDGGGKDEDYEIEKAYEELIKVDVNEVKDFIKKTPLEQKLEIIKEVKKNVSIEDFKEFDLEDGESVFGKMFDGGKRKRSTKRSTKKNKKSNRKRRA